jgi:hypothetical protein
LRKALQPYDILEIRIIEIEEDKWLPGVSDWVGSKQASSAP